MSCNINKYLTFFFFYLRVESSIMWPLGSYGSLLSSCFLGGSNYSIVFFIYFSINQKDQMEETSLKPWEELV